MQVWEIGVFIGFGILLGPMTCWLVMYYTCSAVRNFSNFIALNIPRDTIDPDPQMEPLPRPLADSLTESSMTELSEELADFDPESSPASPRTSPRTSPTPSTRRLSCAQQ